MRHGSVNFRLFAYCLHPTTGRVLPAHIEEYINLIKMNVSKIRKMKKIRKSKKLTEITVHAAVIFDSVQRQGRLSIRT